MRFQVLDSWRGVCALLVALFHLDVLSHVWGLAILRNAYLFVDFFFVLSGFVISHAYGARLNTHHDLGIFMIRRLGRVWPLHLAVLAAFVAVEFVKWLLSSGLGLAAGQPAFDPGGRAALATLPSQILLTQALGLDSGLTWNLPGWSISAEFWTYLVFGLACVVSPKTKSVMLAAVAALSAILVVNFAQHGMDATYDLGFPRCLMGFVLGHLVYRLHRECRRPQAGFTAAMEWVAVIAIVLYVAAAGRGPLSFAAPLVFAIAVYIFSFETGPISQMLRMSPFQSLGLWSYSIYMVHDLVTYVLSLGTSVAQRWLGRDLWHEMISGGTATRVIDFNSTAAGDGLAIGYLAVVIGLASLTYRYVEKPGQRLFARLGERMVPAA